MNVYMEVVGEKAMAVTLDLNSTRDNVEDSQRNLMYKELYHSSLKARGSLQKQLVKHSELLSKHKKIANLKVSSQELGHHFGGGKEQGCNF